MRVSVSKRTIVRGLTANCTSESDTHASALVPNCDRKPSAAESSRTDAMDVVGFGTDPRLWRQSAKASSRVTTTAAQTE